MTNSDEFFHAVHALKMLPPRMRYLAHYASVWWSDERLETAEAHGLLPFDDELQPQSNRRN
jgi:hypothetical protein